MKSVLLSINPSWCNLIFLGIKTLEIRKTKPNMGDEPFKCYAIRQSETQCGYIKQKHNRPVYRKGAKIHEGCKRIVRTKEGFRK